jgi:hypothetical protein
LKAKGNVEGLGAIPERRREKARDWRRFRANRCILYVSWFTFRRARFGAVPGPQISQLSLAFAISREYSFVDCAVEGKPVLGEATADAELWTDVWVTVRTRHTGARKTGHLRRSLECGTTL